YRAVSHGRRGFLAADLAGPAAVAPDDLPDTGTTPAPDTTTETSPHLLDALRGLPADEQVAVQLFVIEELPAAEVARLVGWPNAKAVYNRVSRALATVKQDLEAQGIRRQDL